MANYRIETRSVALRTPKQAWRLPDDRPRRRGNGLYGLNAPAAGELPFTPDSPPLPLSSIQGMPVASGIGLPWNRWTMISDEGAPFLERFSAGAFGDSLRNRSRPVLALLNHGTDSQAGLKPLGRLSLWQAQDGLAYELAFIDASYARDVAAGIRAGLYGMSVRFRPKSVSMNRNPGRSAINPDGLPERTINAARLIELSATPSPAYGGTSAKIA